MNRILITVDPWSPAWSYHATLARALAKRGNDVRVAVFGAEPTSDRRAEIEADGVRIVQVPLQGPSTDPGFIGAAREALETIVEEWKPAVVQIDRCAFGDLDLSVPKVLTVAADRTVRISRGRGPARKGLLGADAVVSPTRVLADEIARRFEYRRNIAVIQPGVEMGDAPVNVSVTKKARRGFTFYGRTDEKASGFDLFLEAGKRLQAEIAERARAQAAEEGEEDAPAVRGPRMVIGGEGNRPPLPGAFEDLGWLDSDERIEAFEKARVAVLPARDDPFGIYAAEAALSGCALLLSDIPAHHEQWHGAAVLVKADDADALAEEMRSLLTDGKKREEVARLCRARALSGFGADRMVEDHLDVYRRIKRAWAKKAGGPPRLSEDVQPLG